MKIQDINEKDKDIFNKVVTHPLQSYEWGEFRKKTGVKVIRKGFYQDHKLVRAFQLTIHKIPYAPWKIGYLPKGTFPNHDELEELKKIGKTENCIFIQFEPNVLIIENLKLKIENLGLQPSFHPLFTKYTFQLDLTKSEEELLKNMYPKTRYNIKIAQKHDVKIIEDNSEKAFKAYLDLTAETIKRQKFYTHTEKYHKLMWETLRFAQGKPHKNELTAYLFLAQYNPPSATNREPLTLAAWIFFVFKDTLYYPYGASSNKYREVMASNLMMWEAIKFGKKLGLKKFDMWGSLGPNPDKNDKWYGFHRFKQGYGGELVEFIGSYDLVINPLLYQIYKILDKIRWLILRFKK